MRRPLAARLALSVVLGAVTTVLVAWGCAALSPVLVPGSWHWAETYEWPHVSGDEPLDTCAAHRPGVSASNMSWGNVGYGWDRYVVGIAAGWPYRALRCHTDRERPDSPPTTWRWHGGAFAGRGIGPTTQLHTGKGTLFIDCPLPIAPYWPGFLANTAIYSAAWSVPLIAPLLIRRWRRKHRGLCLGCGYDASGLDACPECGRTCTPHSGHAGSPASS